MKFNIIADIIKFLVYFNKINEIRVSHCQKNKQSNKKKLQQELEQTNLEYKMLLQQKIKDLSTIINIEQRELITDTYTKLEKEKLDTIIKLKKMLEKQEEQLITEKIENLLKKNFSCQLKIVKEL